MKKTFAAFVAVATIAGSLAATPASAQRGVAAGVAAGLIGGAIVGGAIASSRPAYAGGRSMSRKARRLPLGSRALLGWLRLALPPRRGLATDLTSPARRLTRPFPNPADASAGFLSSPASVLSAPRRSSAARPRSASNPP